MSELKFPCTMCGACCKDLDLAYINEGFNHKVINGTCEHLKDNKCSIYADRPGICSIEKVTEGYSIEDRLSTYKAMARGCNILQEDSGLDAKYRIDVESIK